LFRRCGGVGGGCLSLDFGHLSFSVVSSIRTRILRPVFSSVFAYCAVKSRMAAALDGELLLLLPDSVLP
jgi:hypothetical protein